MLGTARGIETKLVPARGFELALIPPVPLPRSLTPSLLTVPIRMRAAVRETAAVFRRVEADVLIGFGGYVSLPAYLAARSEKLPYVVHEANAKPGLANRWGARFTPFVASSVADHRLPNAVPLGIPLRSEVSSLDRESQRAAARAQFGLLPDAPVLLVSGGSQGARSINRTVVAAAADLGAAGVQVLHVAGPTQRADVEAGAPTRAAAEPPYLVLGYAENMQLAYAAADLMLCRAGAMTCAELTAVGLPGAYVPLPHGNGEQRFNAEPIVEAGGGVMVADADLRPGWIHDTLLPLLTDPARLAAMSKAAATLGRRDADDKLVDMIVEAAGTARAAGKGAPA
ncbi:MAG: UDP-N-acetylglucosamine--N-acetylmuramyl-(pentapeptide) pyrophosphoryl-undecaprenol N-acetylglucosamine transferase, partial [Acidothermaceae bacterium]